MLNRNIAIAAIVIVCGVFILLTNDLSLIRITRHSDALGDGSLSLKREQDWLIIKDEEPSSTPMSRNDVSKEPVKTIAFIGERNSGTTWVHGVLGRCFGEDLQVHNGLTRGRHLFQYDDGKLHNNTILVAQFRNPYHWVLGMRAKPHHSPEHMYMEWREFINKTWTMKRKGMDLLVTDMENRICQEGFLYKEINSCIYHAYPQEYYDGRKTHYSEKRPLYEMRNDGSGEPFNSILELRAAKNRDILTYDQFPFVKKVIVVRYEDLVQEGTANMIKEIEEQAGVKAKCEATPPQSRPVREVEKEYLDYMNANADWESEALIGYKKFVAKKGPKHYRHILL